MQLRQGTVERSVVLCMVPSPSAAPQVDCVSREFIQYLQFCKGLSRLLASSQRGAVHPCEDKKRGCESSPQRSYRRPLPQLPQLPPSAASLGNDALVRLPSFNSDACSPSPASSSIAKASCLEQGFVRLLLVPTLLGRKVTKRVARLPSLLLGARAFGTMFCM